jgi:hypothetical protein
MPRARMILAMLAAPLALAACGGSSQGAVVPSLGGSSAVSSPGATTDADAPLKFAQCMRAAGITNFPDPKPGGGGFLITPRSGLDPNSPQFQAAATSCRKKTGFGGQGGSLQQNALFDKLLKFSECMRAHGIAAFPDPVKGPGGGIIRKAPQGVDPNSPQFQAAKKACDSLLPNGGNGPGGGSLG